MRTCLLLVASGCSRLLGFDELAPSGSPDAPPLPDTSTCDTFSSFLDTCPLQLSGALDLDGQLTFDTNTGALFSGAMPVIVDTQVLTTPSGELHAILADTVVISAGTTLVASGTRPFAIIAGDSITFASGATIDVGVGGAGAGIDCTADAGGDHDSGAGGGGGGGFGSDGGPGGAGDNDGAMMSQGGVATPAVMLPAGIRGGCAGGAGGDDPQDPGGAGGPGGGAVYLVARRSIDLASMAAIDAGGGAGSGGAQHNALNGDAGGGGGGSGGMIVLEAPAITIAGTIAANGGGGGEGSGNGKAGRDGQRGLPRSVSSTGGAGGSPTGGDGGRGGARDTLLGGLPESPQPAGGGGGGGGVGFIRLLAPAPALQVGAVISPDPI